MRIFLQNGKRIKEKTLTVRVKAFTVPQTVPNVSQTNKDITTALKS